jgi:hypothetical protein
MTIILGGMSSVVTAFAVLWVVVPYGMFPHDEGQYGQSAVRILAGELPHRDFHEVYSGGLSYWHAFLFRLFGEQLIVLRRALVVLAMPAVLAAYAIAMRFTANSLLASIVAVAAILGMIGTNHAATPTTYLSLVSTIVAWLLVRYADDEQLWRIIVIGVLCGVALAIKITGLYTLAAAGLAITFCGTKKPALLADPHGQSGLQTSLERLYRGVVATLAIAAGPLLVAAHPTLDSFAYFTAPPIAMGVALLMAGRPFDPRQMLWRHVVLCASVAIAILIFMTPWIMAGAVGDLVDGLFVRPTMRLASAYNPPPRIVFLALAVPPFMACVCAGATTGRRRLAWVGAAFTLALLGFGLTARQPSGFVASAIRTALEGWRWFAPIGCSALALLLVRDEPGNGGRQSSTFAVGATTAFVALNQYPFATPIYFFFAWPLVALLMVAIAGNAGEDRMPLAFPAAYVEARRLSMLMPTVTTIAGFAVFCLIRFGQPGIFVEFTGHASVDGYAPLSGLMVARPVAKHYARLTSLLNEALRPDQTVLAGPDSPDVYFFTGRRNPTPVMYEMFILPHDHSAMLSRLAATDDIGAIILNMEPGFAAPWPEQVGGPLIRHMRRRAQIGKFIVYYDRAD